MSNILDYIDWRGDLSFDDSPLCEVDLLILAELSYLQLQGIVPSGFCTDLSFADAVDRFLKKHAGTKISFGAIVPDTILLLAEKARDSRRFGSLRVCGCRERTEEKEEIQFAALTFLWEDKFACCSFRGTDDTLVGWKENLNLSYLAEVPAQRAAAQYASLAAEMLEGIPALYLTGHSKGGNLAIYAAVKGGEAVRSKLAQVFGGDSPGFSAIFAESDAYRSLLPKILHFVPTASVVGMLMNQEDAANITVRSVENGVFQHDGFSWEVKGRQFLRAEGLTDDAKKTAATVRAWIGGMDARDREELCAALDALFRSSGSDTLSGMGGALELLRSFQRLAPEARRTVAHGLRQLWEARTK